MESGQVEFVILYVIFPLLMLVGGIAFSIFGGRVLLQKGFVEKLQRGRWKDNSKSMSPTEGYIYDKYVRGTFSLIGGLIFLYVAGMMMWKYWF